MTSWVSWFVSNVILVSRIHHWHRTNLFRATLPLSLSRVLIKSVLIQFFRSWLRNSKNWGCVLNCHVRKRDFTCNRTWIAGFASGRFPDWECHFCCFQLNIRIPGKYDLLACWAHFLVMLGTSCWHLWHVFLARWVRQWIHKQDWLDTKSGLTFSEFFNFWGQSYEPNLRTILVKLS